RSWRLEVAKRCQRQQIEIAARRRSLDARTLLMLLDDVWYRVELDVLPAKESIEKIVDGESRRCVVAEARYDVVLRRRISRGKYDELQLCKHMYGSSDVYAVRKQQISTQEIKRHGLRA